MPVRQRPKKTKVLPQPIKWVIWIMKGAFFIPFNMLIIFCIIEQLPTYQMTHWNGCGSVWLFITANQYGGVWMGLTFTRPQYLVFQIFICGFISYIITRVILRLSLKWKQTSLQNQISFYWRTVSELINNFTRQIQQWACIIYVNSCTPLISYKTKTVW